VFCDGALEICESEISRRRFGRFRCIRLRVLVTVKGYNQAVDGLTQSPDKYNVSLVHIETDLVSRYVIAGQMHVAKEELVFYRVTIEWYAGLMPNAAMSPITPDQPVRSYLLKVAIGMEQGRIH
jgi:hypothetical protein